MRVLSSYTFITHLPHNKLVTKTLIYTHYIPTSLRTHYTPTLTSSLHTHLETSRTPVDEGYCSLCPELSDGGVDILGHHVTTEEEAAGHVLALLGVTLHLQERRGREGIEKRRKEERTCLGSLVTVVFDWLVWWRSLLFISWLLR